MCAGPSPPSALPPQKKPAPRGFGAARPASVRANNATCAWQVSALQSLVTPEGALLAQCGDAALNATVVITVLF